MKFEKEIKQEILNNYRKGQRVKEICDKYGVKKSTLFSLINKENIMSKREKRLLNNAKEYKTLEIAYKKLQTEYAILNDAFIVLNLDLTTKLSVSDILLNKYPLKQIARILHFSSSTLFHHVHDKVEITKLQKEDDKLKEIINELFGKSGKRLSVKKMYYLLKSKNIKCSQRRVSRLMKKLNLKRKPKKTKKDRPKTFPNFNKLKQEFNQPAPNLFWCGDVTMYKINDNKFYIAIVLDLFSKMVVGYAISSRNDEYLVINALKMAYEFRNCPLGVTFHSDQGSNYKSTNFINLLHILKINQSFSKKGTPFDNSPIESFFSNLKQGDLNNRDFEYLEDLKIAVKEYVNYYNYQRPHKALGFKTPFDFEKEYHKKS